MGPIRRSAVRRLRRPPFAGGVGSLSRSPIALLATESGPACVSQCLNAHAETLGRLGVQLHELPSGPGRNLGGRFHDVPRTIKESSNVQGTPVTNGRPDMKGPLRFLPALALQQDIPLGAVISNV